MFDFVNFLSDNATDCVFDWKLNLVKSTGSLEFKNEYVEDLIVLGNHYFNQYSTLQFNYDSDLVAFIGAPVGHDPTYGFPFWKLAVILAGVLVVAILGCLSLIHI